MQLTLSLSSEASRPDVCSPLPSAYKGIDAYASNLDVVFRLNAAKVANYVLSKGSDFFWVECRDIAFAGMGLGTAVERQRLPVPGLPIYAYHARKLEPSKPESFADTESQDPAGG